MKFTVDSQAMKMPIEELLESPRPIRHCGVRCRPDEL